MLRSGSHPFAHYRSCPSHPKMWFSYVAVILFVATCAEGYSSGIPERACENMLPRHRVPPQDDDPPYFITTSTEEVQAGIPMEVTISGMEANDTIRGIMLQARAGDDIVGVFTVDPYDPLITTMNCCAEGDTVTHKEHENKDDRQTVSVTWTSPDDFNDVIKFRATIVLRKAVFWVGVESASVKVTS